MKGGKKNLIKLMSQVASISSSVSYNTTEKGAINLQGNKLDLPLYRQTHTIAST